MVLAGSSLVHGLGQVPVTQCPWPLLHLHTRTHTCILRTGLFSLTLCILAFQQHIGTKDAFLQAYYPDKPTNDGGKGGYEILWRSEQSDALLPGSDFLMSKYWMCLDKDRATFGVRNIKLMDVELDLAKINHGRPLQPRYYALKCSKDDEGHPFPGIFSSIQVHSASTWASFLDQESVAIESDDLCPIDNCATKGDKCECEACLGGYRLSSDKKSCVLETCLEKNFPHCESFKSPSQGVEVTHDSCGCALCNEGATESCFCTGALLRDVILCHQWFMYACRAFNTSDCCLICALFRRFYPEDQRHGWSQGGRRCMRKV